MNNAPENFDWVSARSQCSLGEVFERLRQQVKRDVEKREEISKQRSGIESYFGFKFLDARDDFTVTIQGNKLYGLVCFQCENDAITAKGRGGDPPNLTAHLTLSNDGNCRLVVDGVEYELWQFRKMALESLFFGPISTST